MRVSIKRTKNLALIRKLDAQFFPGSDLSDDGLENSLWWLALDQGEIVGYAGLYVGIEGEVWLLRLAVARTHRRLGLGRRLLAVRLRKVRQSYPGQECYTYTEATNVGSNRNLVNAGFTPFKVESGEGGYKWVYWFK